MLKSNVMKNLWVGEFPTAEDVRGLKESGITAIMSVAHPFGLSRRNRIEMAACVDLGILYVNDGFEDGSFLSKERVMGIRKIISILRVFDYNVYLHCVAGLSRSPFVATLAVMDDHHITFDEARLLVGSVHKETNIDPELIRSWKDNFEAVPVR